MHHNSAHTPASMLKLHLFEHKVLSKLVHPFVCLLIALLVLAIASATALLSLLLLHSLLSHTVHGNILLIL